MSEQTLKASGIDGGSKRVQLVPIADLGDGSDLGTTSTSTVAGQHLFAAPYDPAGCAWEAVECFIIFRAAVTDSVLGNTKTAQFLVRKAVANLGVEGSETLTGATTAVFDRTLTGITGTTVVKALIPWSLGAPAVSAAADPPTTTGDGLKSHQLASAGPAPGATITSGNNTKSFFYLAIITSTTVADLPLLDVYLVVKPVDHA